MKAGYCLPFRFKYSKYEIPELPEIIRFGIKILKRLKLTPSSSGGSR